MNLHWERIIRVLCLISLSLSGLSSSVLAASSLPAKLADYQGYLAAVEHSAGARYPEAIASLAPVWSFRPESPLTGTAALLAARAYLELAQPKPALTLLERYSSRLPQPGGDLVLAKSLEAAGEGAPAAAAYQRIFYGKPLAAEAGEAEQGLLRLEQLLGPAFPPPMPEAMLDRAAKLMRSGQTAKAKEAYLLAAGRVAGKKRELALVRAGAGDAAYLSALEVSNGEADAERLYLLHAASRRASDDTTAASALEELNRKYPSSKWRLEALISWGNHFSLRNQPDDYGPLFRACLENFPDDPQAELCHWKLAWSAWMSRSPDAAAMLRDHLARFPDSAKAAAANYFLGNYGVILDTFPLSYYAILAREKVSGSGRPPAKTLDLSPTPATAYRIDRARLLKAAGYPQWAEFELKFAASDQPYVVAIELAQLAASQGAHDRALRYIKSLAKGYLEMPLESAPASFWRLAFPLPYRSDLESNSRQQGLDPHLIAGLVRQESEFNPKAVSRAKAYGLTQVLPSTGRELSRRVGLRTFKPSMLFDPAVNLRLGTTYFRKLLDQLAGNEAETLASYNAGKRRAVEWLTWYDYREPAEFIETIPISETRIYVQTVLRNADVYRRIYGGVQQSAVSK